MIEKRYNPPFGAFKHKLGVYVVRPIDWEGAWDSDGILHEGNFMLNVPDKEEAEMIANTFNRFFELLKENERLKQALNKIRNRLDKGCCVEIDEIIDEVLGDDIEESM